jgi:diguanylate cyclase (GGDEF)-like protein
LPIAIPVSCAVRERVEVTREMAESKPRKPNQSAALLLCMLLTLLAVVGHRFLPERRLSITSSPETGNFFLGQTGDGPAAEITWTDRAHLAYHCRVPQATVWQSCNFGYMLATEIASKGLDLSGYKTLNLAVRYTGKAQYVRVSIRNFDPRFSKIEDGNSPKFNFVNIPSKDLARPISLKMSEFTVAEWWVTSYDHPRAYSQLDVSNATVLNIDLQGNIDLAGSEHDFQIDRIEFVGDWISAEYWYLGILCIWMILGTTYGTAQWVRMRRAHRRQREQINDLENEKDMYQKLSTMDALTGVQNRHGIGQFIAALGITRVSASVIVIDLDHFKRINDERGHAIGDRVLRTMGDILASSIRNTDAVGRWGGEEFVLVCPGATLSDAADLAEKLRHRILQTNFIPEDPLPISASFGVATSGIDQRFEDVFRKADQALYLAKSRGRNCVVTADDEQVNRITGKSKGALALISGRFKLHK